VRNGRPLGTLTQRLETALALYRAGRVKTILVSGNEIPASPEVSAMHGWLRERGVPEADVWSDLHGTRTRETMLNAASKFNVTDAIICTQAAYVDRAVFLARQVGIDAVGVGLPSPASRSARWIGLEVLKTTAAFFESYVRPGPARDDRARGVALVAAR
jgi:SanA protein